MSALITTSTVTTVVAAVSIAEIASAFTLVLTIMLALTLLSKEVIAQRSSSGALRLTRGLDIALTPLLISFVLVLVIRAMQFGEG